MGLRFRRSIKIAPGIRVNLNKKSASVTFGPKGLKHTVSTAISRIETGDRIVADYELEYLADALGVTIYYLLGKE